MAASAAVWEKAALYSALQLRSSTGAVCGLRDMMCSGTDRACIVISVCNR